MKAVIIDIKSKWRELIFARIKKLEVRKIMPNINPPFVCLLSSNYQCDDSVDGFVMSENNLLVNVFGEILVDSVSELKCDGEIAKSGENFDISDACVSIKEIYKYSLGKPLYLWHIENVKKYEAPLRISIKADRLLSRSVAIIDYEPIEVIKYDNE